MSISEEHGEYRHAQRSDEVVQHLLHPLAGSGRWLSALIFVIAITVSPTLTSASAYTLVGWNNLGMHCMDADYSVFALLPPYNTIHAQLIDPQGRLVRDASGITVTYQAVADPDGSINTTSAGKTNFWQFALSLFGVSPAVDAGLAGKNMPGPTNQPQPMSFDATSGWFVAEGIPITPYDDTHRKQPYPLMRLVAHDTNGATLASTDIVLPVSDEMDCRSCHASNTSPSAQPVDGWVNDPDPQRDMRLNILRLHDDRESGTDAFQNALNAAGYSSAGLFATVMSDDKSILCARCHASEALPGSGLAGIESLTLAVHRRMASVVDPLTGNLLDASDNRSACYRCHPGAVTRCLRGAMGNAVAADGTPAIQCQSCHGSMHALASPTRTGWLDEPACQSCHTGTATHNNGQIRYVSAFDTSGQARVAVDSTYATNPDTPDTGHSLYRFSTGHGGLKCEACHGSTHAEFPSSHRNDNLQSITHQGHVGVLAECTACHPSQPNTITGGPHGMHPIGQVWVDRHPDLIEERSPAQCQACHGADYRGTELSRAQADRTLTTEFGTKQIWRGFEIGCYTCHQGPRNSDRNPNHAPQVENASATTAAETPVSIALNGHDVDGNPITLRIVSQPTHGTVGIEGGMVTYFPEAGFIGSDSFTFAARDGSTDSNLGSVAVAVTGIIVTPTAVATLPTATATSTPTPTPTPPLTAACIGDCDASRAVTVDELVLGVNIALGSGQMTQCPAFDCNHNGQLTVDCLVKGVNAALNGCSVGPVPTGTATGTAPPIATPTASAIAPATATSLSATPTMTPAIDPNATLANIQSSILSPSCATQFCHTATDQAGGLVLESGSSHSQLIGVLAVNPTANNAGLLRVNPGNPDNSFLLIKLIGPSAAQGSRMPLGQAPLTAAQVRLIRDWIAAGALP